MRQQPKEKIQASSRAKGLLYISCLSIFYQIKLIGKHKVIRDNDCV